MMGISGKNWLFAAHTWLLAGWIASLGACSANHSPTSPALGPSHDAGAGDPGPAGWIPSVPGAGPANHNAAVTVSTQVVTASGPILGLGDRQVPASEITVAIDMTADLGPQGSLTLVARASGFAKDFEGGAYAVLVSLTDGYNELINLTRDGEPWDCAGAGFYLCSKGSCSLNPYCVIRYPSAYFNTTQWQLHQFQATGSGAPSVNTFPTCNDTGGIAGSSDDPACAFNQVFFPAGVTPSRLRYGTTYYAKYVLLADSYSTVSGFTGTLTVDIYKKTAAQIGGAVDLNVILVGDANVDASHTAKGQQNLNTIFAAVQGYLDQATSKIKLGQINVVEWGGAAGNAYAALPSKQVGSLLAQSGALAPPGTEGKTANVFLVSSLSDSNNSGFTLVGEDGAISGPPINGTPSSGLVVATSGKLDQFNPGCSAGAAICPLTQQESAFWQVGKTIAHEIGHLLGLQHPTEANASTSDAFKDTPLCTALDHYSTGEMWISNYSCSHEDGNYYVPTGHTCPQVCGGYNAASGALCPAAPECAFNYLMWPLAQNFDASTGVGDGNLLSTESGIVANYSPFVQ